MRGETVRQRDHVSQMRRGQGSASEQSPLNGSGRSPRRRVKGSLAEQLRLLESLTDNASVALFIVDEGQQCRYMNCAAEQLTGYTFAETLGRSLHEVVHHTKPDGLPHPLAECSIAQAFAEEHQTQGEDIFVHKDGYFYPIVFTASPIRDEGGKRIGTIIEVQDIAIRKATEEALPKSEARYRNVFEYAGSGIVITDVNGSFIQCNPAYCAILGYTEGELRRLKLFEMIHPEDRARNSGETDRLLLEGCPHVEIENRYVHKNGQSVWVHQFVSLLRDHESEPKYFVIVVTNVTEQRKAQGRLQRWNIELEQALNEKTVELRQSQERLRALASELNLAEQRERKRLANELHDHLQQLLVLGKLTIGQGKRFTSGMPDCEIVLKKVDDILSEALTYSRTLVTELSPPVLHDHGLAGGLRWLGDYMKKHGQTVTVMAPEDQDLKLPENQVILLFQSVRELLINSLKHAGTNEATVRMDQRDDYLRIEVHDEGAGFDVAATAADTSNSEISSKFGLFSIQERLRALGASFAIHSVPKYGTTATLVLPMTRSAEDSRTHPSNFGTDDACITGSADDSGGHTMRTEDLSSYCS